MNKNKVIPLFLFIFGFFVIHNLRIFSLQTEMLMLGLSMIALAVTQFLYKRSFDLNRLLAKAERDFELGKLKKAQKKYERVIALFQKQQTDARGKTLDSKQAKIEARAYLGLGNIHYQHGASKLATINYRNAAKFGLTLPDEAVVLMANHYAQKKERLQHVLDIYVRYIELMPPDETSKTVYSVLETNCRIEETTPTSERKKLIALNLKVLSARTDIEWAHYYLGLAYQLEGKHETSISHLEAARDLDLSRKLTYYWLGMGYLNQSKTEPEKAIRVLTEFLTFQSKNKDLLQKQGEAAFKLGCLVMEGIDRSAKKQDREKLAEAIQYLETAIARNENNEAYHFHLGKAYSLENEPAKAIDAFERALALSPDNKKYLYAIAKEYLNMNSAEQAIAKLQAALAVDESYADAHDLLAEIYLKTKEFENAESHSRTAIALKGYNRGRLTSLFTALYKLNRFEAITNELEQNKGVDQISGRYNELIFLVASAYSKIGIFDAAINWFSKLPEGPERHYHLGCAHANKGDDEQALDYFGRIIESEDKLTEKALLQRGILFSRTGKIKEAEADFQNALKINPKNFDALANLGCLYYNASDFDKASTVFSQLLKQKPRHPLANFSMGLIQEKGGKIDQAIDTYKRILKHDSDELPVRTRLGILHCQQKEYQKAIEYFESEKTQNSEDDARLFYFGMALVGSGQFEKGITLWKKLLQRHPEDERLELNILRAHYQLGMQHIQDEKYGEAILQWNEYLDKYTEDENTKHNLAEIYFRKGISAISEGESGHLDTAKGHFEKAIELHEDHAIYHLYNCLCDFALGNPAESIRKLGELGKSQPNDTRIRYHLALVMLRNGEKNEAIRTLEKLAAAAANDAYSQHASWILVNNYIQEQAYDKAISLMEKCL